MAEILKYGATAKWLHWLVAFIVILMLIFGPGLGGSYTECFRILHLGKQMMPTRRYPTFEISFLFIPYPGPVMKLMMKLYPSADKCVFKKGSML